MPRRNKNDDGQFEKGLHAPDLRNLAIECLETYFEGKSWFIGGPVPSCEYLSDNSIKMLLRTKFDDKTFMFIHQHCLPKISQPDNYTEPTVPWTVSFLIGLLADMKRLGVPKDFQPGLLLLHFKFY